MKDKPALSTGVSAYKSGEEPMVGDIVRLPGLGASDHVVEYVIGDRHHGNYLHLRRISDKKVKCNRYPGDWIFIRRAEEKQ